MGIFEKMREDQHCINDLALDRRGVVVDPRDPRAEYWCALGWIRSCTDSDTIAQRYRDVALRVALALGFPCVQEANDVMGWEFIKVLKSKDI